MQGPYFVDAHCHLTDERVYAEAELWIQNAIKNQVQKMMIGGLDPADWARQKSLKQKYPDQILMSFGLHPWWVEKLNDEDVGQALQILSSELIHAQALGETGLDFHPKRLAAHFKRQEAAFRSHLRLALKHRKPVVLHLVKSHARALEIVREEEAETLLYLLHSFSGSKEEAREWLKLGAVLSFNGGVMVDGKFEKMKEVLAMTPLSQMVFETDAPDQAWRADGKNEPCYIREIYQRAADRLKIPLLELMQNVAENFAKFG